MGKPSLKWEAKARDQEPEHLKHLSETPDQTPHYPYRLIPGIGSFSDQLLSVIDSNHNTAMAALLQLSSRSLLPRITPIPRFTTRRGLVVGPQLIGAHPSTYGCYQVSCTEKTCLLTVHGGTRRRGGGGLRGVRESVRVHASVEPPSYQDGDDGDTSTSSEPEEFLRDAPLNVWDIKPPWCQPWTIVSTGFAIIGVASIPHWTWLTAIASLGVFTWWYLFLGVYASQYKEAVIAARAGDNEAARFVAMIVSAYR